MKKSILFLVIAILLFGLVGCYFDDTVVENKQKMQSLYGENKEISTSYDDSLAAYCYNGIFVGKEENGVLSFKGIPYAQAPIGELRWKEAAPALENDSVYEAYYFGKSPIQTEWVSEKGSYYPQSEDCLYLNVWTTGKEDLTDKAVMVFFHGGSYGWGGTSDPLYDGQNFVEAHNDIVLVTVGYRTGLMGFLDLSSLDSNGEYEKSGNLGLLDQVAALKWVQQNIAAFGGDPNNVTIFGESAGAGSVSLLPLIEEAKGLFQRVIAESGSFALTFSSEECQELTTRLLKESGVSTLEELLALSEEDLMKLNESLNDYNNFPERDGVVLPKDLYEAYENGVAADIDMMIGTNADECRYWIREMGYYIPGISGELIYKIGMPVMYKLNTEKMSVTDSTYLETFMSLQTEGKVWNITEFYNDILFRVPAIAMAESNYKNGGNVFMYYWEYPSAIDNLGACHAVELAYVFNNLDETVFTGNNIDPNLATEVQNMWVNFAKTGNPSTKNNTWEKYDIDNRTTMILGTDIHMENDYLSEQRTNITPLLKYGLNGSYTEVFEVIYRYAAIIGIVLLVIAILAGMLIYRKKKHK